MIYPMGEIGINDNIKMYKRSCGQKLGLERSSYVFKKTKRKSDKTIYSVQV